MSSNQWLRYGKPITAALRGVLQEVHAVRAVQGTALPYCVYRRSGLDRVGDSLDKDSGSDDYAASYEVHLYTADYVDGLNLIERVIAALRGIRGLQVELTDAGEDVVEDGLQFLQSITVSVR